MIKYFCDNCGNEIQESEFKSELQKETNCICESCFRQKVYSNTPEKLIKVIERVSKIVSQLDEIFGVGGAEDVEAYAGCDRQRTEDIGSWVNYGRCQQALSNAAFSLTELLNYNMYDANKMLKDATFWKEFNV